MQARDTVGNALEIARIEHQAERHDVQPQESRHADAQQQIARFRAIALVAPGVVGDAISQAGNGRGKALAGQKARTVAHLHQIRGEEDVRGYHAALLVEGVLDQPRAGGAPHPGDLKEGFADFRIGRSFHLRFLFLAI